MKILQIIGSLDPEFGGPPEIVSLQTDEMIKQGQDVSIVTLDRPDRSYLQNVPFTVYALGPTYGKYRVNFRLTSWLKKNGLAYDLVVIHGIWQFLSTATWMFCKKNNIPYFVWTHGTLDPWFNKSFPIKYIEKWLSWKLVDHKILRDAAGTIFTCEEEKMLASKSFTPYKVNELIAVYGNQKPPDNPDVSREIFFQAFPDLRKKRIILFLSRIHPKKGCDLLLEAFSRICNKYPDLHLVMAGPDKDNWIPKLKERTKQLRIEEQVTWTGMLKGDLKWGAFRAADVFILPSHSENFGMVIVEAMACRLPVLTTNKVNIWREIKKDSAGIIGQDTSDSILEIMNKWLSLSDEERSQMRGNAEESFRQRFEIQTAVKNLLAKFQIQLDLPNIKNT